MSQRIFIEYKPDKIEIKSHYRRDYTNFFSLGEIIACVIVLKCEFNENKFLICCELKVFMGYNKKIFLRSNLMSCSITIDYHKHSTKALLLGSGELGKEVAIELIRYGIDVTACDRYDNAPAMQVAQNRAVIDMRDPDELEKLILKINPDYIIPEIEAISTETLLSLEERGFNVVPSARAANITMNREAIRTLAAEELSLPTSPYFFASSVEEVKENIHKIGFPCIMKPIMSSSGKGQSVLKSEADIENSFKEAIEHGRGGLGRVIVEGFVQFDREITLLTVNAVDGIHFCEAV